MVMSVISALRDILRAADDRSAEDEEHLTIASLLILVAQADGRVLPVETDGLRRLLAVRFGFSSQDADRVLRSAAEIEAGMDSATTLIDRIATDVPPEEHGNLLALAYKVAAIDGTVHEFEDDLIWRTGRLLRFSDDELADIKARAIGTLSPGRADD
jgi:uncharacterized tellurite resistance protein B-like protein